MNSVALEDKLRVNFGVNPLFVRARIKQFLSWYEQGDAVLTHETQELMKSKSKPFVKWVGGKRQLAKQFRDRGLYPPNGFDPQVATYHEPFVGGGAMFFDALPLKNVVLSDMNLELITAYNVIKNDVDSLIKKLKEHNLQSVNILYEDYKKN